MSIDGFHELKYTLRIYATDYNETAVNSELSDIIFPWFCTSLIYIASSRKHIFNSRFTFVAFTALADPFQP